ncbi:MAG: class I SAM-dependent methyltransferase [Anaerolineaceae bacterium]|nr:class I SAM-dependent methyltransferase [Anaerolineaceae bacterium]
MPEQDYYEAAAFWKPDRYINPDETERLTTCAAFITDDAQSLLDVGCGNGTFLTILERQRPAMRLNGLERSRTAVQSAICTSEVLEGAITAIPFADRAFDVVTALEVIEHLPYQVYEHGLRELERVAAKGILLSVPYRENRVFTECPNCGCRFHPNYHLRSFDEHVLEHLFQQFDCAAYEVVSIDDYWLAPVLRRLYRLLNRHQDYPKTALCPQCGYTRSGGGHSRSAPAESASFLNRVRRYLRDTFKARLPKYKRKNWIIAYYQRK